MSADSHTEELGPMESPPHFTTAMVADYFARRLSPAQILALHDHADACDPCRGMLGGEADDHLTEQEAVDFVAGTRRSPEMEGHVAKCAECGRVVKDLREFQQELSGEAESGKRNWIWQLAAAAALFLVAAAGFWFLRPTQRGNAPVVASLGDRALGDRALGDAALVDGAVVPGISETTRQQIAAAMASGQLPAEPGPLAMNATGTLRSTVESRAGAPAAVFHVLTPAGTREESDRPVFRWQPLAGAESYEVMIFDADFNPVLRSGRLTGTEWQASETLPRAKFLTWQVAAIRGGEKVTSPQPPEPSAVFEIIPAETAREIALVKSSAQPQHLALAVLYTRAGLHDLALREVQALAAANPRSGVVKSMQESLGKYHKE